MDETKETTTRRPWTTIAIGAIVAAVSVYWLVAREATTAREASAPKAEFLVWTAGETGGPTTHHIRGTASGYELVATIPGLHWTDGKTLWSATTEERKVRQCDCPAWMELGENWFDQPCPSHNEDGKEQVLHLRGRGGASYDLGAPAQRGEVDDDGIVSDVDHSIRPTATIGHHLLYVDAAYMYACGAAHGNFGSRLLVFDTTTGKHVEWSEWGDVKLKADDLKLKAFGELGEDIFSESPDKLVLTGLFPRWDSAGALHVDYQLTADACYACSDDWASYSRSARVESDAVPDAWAAARITPAAVAAFAREHGPIGGWSPVVGDLNGLESAAAPTP